MQASLFSLTKLNFPCSVFASFVTSHFHLLALLVSQTHLRLHYSTFLFNLLQFYWNGGKLTRIWTFFFFKCTSLHFFLCGCCCLIVAILWKRVKQGKTKAKKPLQILIKWGRPWSAPWSKAPSCRAEKVKSSLVSCCLWWFNKLLHSHSLHFW